LKYKFFYPTSMDSLWSPSTHDPALRHLSELYTRSRPWATWYNKSLDSRWAPFKTEGTLVAGSMRNEGWHENTPTAQESQSGPGFLARCLPRTHCLFPWARPPSAWELEGMVRDHPVQPYSHIQNQASKCLVERETQSSQVQKHCPECSPANQMFSVKWVVYIKLWKLTFTTGWL
jgi:hypothetical protein